MRPLRYGLAALALLFSLRGLALATLLVSFDIDALFQGADFVGMVKITDCDDPHHRSDIPRARILRAFKSNTDDSHLHFGYLRVDQLGSAPVLGGEFLVFLKCVPEGWPIETHYKETPQGLELVKMVRGYRILWNDWTAWPTVTRAQLGLTGDELMVRVNGALVPEALEIGSFRDEKTRLEGVRYVRLKLILDYLQKLQWTETGGR